MKRSRHFKIAVLAFLLLPTLARAQSTQAYTGFKCLSDPDSKECAAEKADQFGALAKNSDHYEVSYVGEFDSPHRVDLPGDVAVTTRNGNVAVYHDFGDSNILSRALNHVSGTVGNKAGLSFDSAF